MSLRAVALDDKYTLDSGRVYLTGTQALVRLALMQRQRDAAAGLNTAGYVTGYRGSPLGAIDREFGGAAPFLHQHQVKFHPAVNEDLAATALWGTQQVGLYPGAKHDGVFGIWYGKGPGVDRSGDALRHANMAGTSPHGGVLLLAGDDPACKSSTVPSQSEHALMDANIPVLNPANVQEVLDFGLLGFALSRYSGCWIGMKCITDNVDSSMSVSVDGARSPIIMPGDFEMPDGGLHIRWPDSPQEQEYRLQKHKIYATLAFARANNINRITMDSPRPRFGIISTGKSYLDTLQALDDLGIDQAGAEKVGLRLYKVGMPWPLERDGIRHFAEGLDEILVIEEKRAVMENQIKEQLYNWRADVRPRVVGKFDENGAWILPSAGELTPARISRVIAARIALFHDETEAMHERLAFLEAKERVVAERQARVDRVPYFCSGCPHNTSTKIPDGMRAAAGIGCHYMVTWMDRDTSTFTHMGAEGANWIGQAPFTETEHIFVNLGDGTYFHSGIMAIRAAVAAGVNITYKILYNDAVAMTGGQPMDGPLDVPTVTRQVHAEGAGKIIIVSDEPDKYPIGANFAPGVTFHHRDQLDEVQRDLAKARGVSVLVYDQTCAAEKRRRRKRGLYPDPPLRPFINEAVCEGCGDCGVQSNCVSIVPKETELGRKRAIDQSSCNKDFTCIDGFCPSFVTVHGAEPRKRRSAGQTPFPALPEPPLASSADPYGIVVTGIGGTGVVTVGALIAMAAHMESKGVTVLDIAGLAQKNGAVYSHIRIADDPDDLHAVRIAAGGADLLIGCDMVTSAGGEALGKLHEGETRAVVNRQRTMTADFTQNPDQEFPEAEFTETITAASDAGRCHFVEATRLAAALLGDSIAANVFMIGYAYQQGYLPLSGRSLEAAIELNGVAVEFNKLAFTWGRRAAHDLSSVEKIARPGDAVSDHDPRDFIQRRVDDLTAYQDAAYADKFSNLVARVREAEQSKTPGMSGLADTVAKSYYKLLAVKDEYEVARLFTDGRFEARLRQSFQDGWKLTFHLAPPIMSERDPVTGHLVKREFGPWMMTAFRILARFKGLRGTALDPFGRSSERRADVQLIADFEANIETILKGLTPENHAIGTEIAALPMQIRGFGHVKEAAMDAARACHHGLITEFTGGGRRTGQEAAE